MRNRWMTVLLALPVLAGLMVAASPAATAQGVNLPAAVTDPEDLPRLPPVVPEKQRTRYVWLATGAGAAIGVIVADVVTGGLLLSPLGFPSAAVALTLEAAGPAIAPPTYSIGQRLLAGVATVAAAVGGGYLGSYLGQPGPDFMGIDE